MFSVQPNLVVSFFISIHLASACLLLLRPIFNHKSANPLSVLEILQIASSPQKGITMSITLYHVAGSRSVRSLWLLRELGIDFELHEIEFTLKALRAPEYLKIHPLGRVPCLKHNDTVIFESGAIAQYLCELTGSALMPKAGEGERGEWLQWLHYAETMAVHAASLVQQRVFIPKENRSEAVQEVEKRRLGQTLSMLNKHLADREYMLASGFSAVDTNVGYSVQLAKNFIPIDGWENVCAYRDRVVGRPHAQQSFPENMRS